MAERNREGVVVNKYRQRGRRKETETETERKRKRKREGKREGKRERQIESSRPAFSCPRLLALSQSSETENSDLSDIELIQHINVDANRLAKLLNEIIQRFR